MYKLKSCRECFEEKFVKGDDCWEWTANKDRSGYGQFSFFGVNQGAHRASYQFYIGEIPEGLQVLHKCDNRACVNPSHLFLGTNADNVRDREDKGRTAVGEKSGRAKLTEEQIVEIRAMRKEGDKLTDLARLYKVSQQQISRIALHQSWGKLWRSQHG